MVSAIAARAQEHPKEHPKEHPTAKAISTADLEKAIRANIDEAAKANNGRFPAKDDVLNKTWQLTLVRVHTDKLTQLDASTYFACVDFKADDGTLVDVDFYFKDDAGQLKRTDTTVHKINGQPRYNYEKKGDFWVRVPVGQAPEKKEHPKGEHPKF
ncbi:MAG: hypothetical protein A2620_08000 [Acidobacteria bacterium RIFCSPHIGHO2_01_FULL_67_28]|nr:MAG: hypothetical protein A2620_08000 [Acidobacteria bacterium RIFCSPHIGHO2_01_FULL_67_28]